MSEKTFVRSCDKECLKPCEGKISGSIPEWLEGSLCRNGPGKYQVGDTRYKHFFDGLSVMHRFEIRPGGKVTYQNRFLDSVAYRKCMKADRVVVSEFGTYGYTDPCATLFDRFKSTFSLGEVTDNANINFMKIGDSFYVATETNFITRVDPKTLETKDRADLYQMLSVNTSTAHPHYASDGALINIGSSYIGRPSYCFVQFPKETDESLEQGFVICRVPSTSVLYPSYYHSFGMTTNYIVLVEQSLVVSLPRMVWGSLARKSFRESLRWCPQQLTRFQIVCRKTGRQLQTNLVTEAILVFHHANAYDSDDESQIVLDLCAFDNDDVVKAGILDHMFDDESANDDVTRKSSVPFRRVLGMLQNRTLRFVLPLREPTPEQVKSGSNLVTVPGTRATAMARKDGSIFCTPDHLSEGLSMFEMPQYNYSAVNGKKYKYLYGIGKDPETNHGLAKLGVEKRCHVMWSEEGSSPSEPVFVPRPGATEEDDGVLLSSLLSESDPRLVSLLVLDAATMQELARVRFESPGVVPADLHGSFHKV